MERVRGIKVVTAREMGALERRAFARGASAQVFMEQAAQGIGQAVEEFALTQALRLLVTLLVGKGNNGGDALAAGLFLLQRGFTVRAVCLYSADESGPLCKRMRESFVALGGLLYENDAEAPIEGIIVDGLIGTACRGPATGSLAALIERANGSGCPILSVDLPSGLDGDTGEAGVAIRATQTLYLELPKRGFFVGAGWNHVGVLRRIRFGLAKSAIEEAQAVGYLVDEEALCRYLPPIQRNRHKYEAGYVLACAGSSGMSGAAWLACTAALKAGAGIARLFYPKGMPLEGAPVELILQPWDVKAALHEAERAAVFLIGPGMGRSRQAARMYKQLIRSLSLPMVIDADALFFAGDQTFSPGTILTPHRGEMRGLLSPSSLSFEERCQIYAQEHAVTVILKGCVTWVFSPQGAPFLCVRGDPGMATGGSGDVLAGITAALLAQKAPSWLAALLATHLHGLAGEKAALKLTSYCLTASDLIAYLPEAFFEVRGKA